MNILSVAEMREIERQADAAGLSYAQMMQNAGQGAAAIIGDRVRRGLASADRPARVVVLVGPGNNGGDGLVCAAALSDAAAREGFRLTVQVYLLKPRPDDDPVFRPVRERGLFVADAANDVRLRVLHQMVTHASVIVDALLGTGASRPIEGLLRDILREVRANRPSLVVALDGVTGMNYDTGALDPSAAPADMTVTFHAPKRGHYCFPAAGACGELVVAPIGVAGDAPARICLADDALICRLLPERRLDANKGTHGRSLIVGGCSDYSGAPALAAAAAYRAGAGLVTAAVPPAIQPIVASACREVTYATLPGSDGSLVPGALPRVLEWVEGAKDRSALLIGPGMGQAAATRGFYFSLLQRLRSNQDLKLVIDADGLNMLAAIEGWPDTLPERCVLTPHPGEMARLSASSVQDVQADRMGLALSSAAGWKQVVLLKGAYTVVASPEGRATVMPFANPAMAVAGMGDVLAGVIVSFMAQGLSPYDAAVCGAYLHGKAGEQWRSQHGDAGLLASDLLLLLPDAAKAIVHSRQTSRDD